MFFAFSNAQFDENKTPLEPDEKYVNLGAGAFIPKNSLQPWKDGLVEINQWEKDQVKDRKLRADLILYELHNHECFYTGDVSAAMSALGPDFTTEEVTEIYRKNFKTATADL